MAKKRACKKCRTIYTSGSKCPKCGAEESSDGFKGKVLIFNPQESEIAKNMKLNDKGEFAIKL